MGDDELEELRKRRAAQLQKQQETEANQELLQQLRKGAQLFMTREAADRLDRVRYAHPEKAVLSEQVIIEMVKRGQVSRESPLSDEQLVNILKSFGDSREASMEFR